MLREQRQRQYRDIGLLILRVGLGVTFIIHGFPTIFGGPEAWGEAGMAMQHIGVDFGPVFFGFIAGAIELLGGLFLMLGLFFTPTLILLFLLMIFVTAIGIGAGEPFLKYSHGIEMAIVFLSLLFIRAGKYNLDKKIQDRQRRY